MPCLSSYAGRFCQEAATRRRRVLGLSLSFILALLGRRPRKSIATATGDERPPAIYFIYSTRQLLQAEIARCPRALGDAFQYQARPRYLIATIAGPSKDFRGRRATASRATREADKRRPADIIFPRFLMRATCA